MLLSSCACRRTLRTVAGTTFILAFCASSGVAQAPPKTLHGLDFSPYLNGQNPNLNPQIPIDQIRTRMQVVAPYTTWVRSFGSVNGLEKTPQVARELGLKIAAGAWLSKNLTANSQEIANLIAAANAGQVDMAVVGSEVLLRNDLTESQLIAYMNQVRQAIPSNIPVTTGEVYGTLISHPNVIAASDVVFANFYPYWEGVSIENAICTLVQQYQTMVGAAGGKQVIISETGWPSGGNAVGAAIPSPANATKYFLQFVSWAKANNVAYFYFVAFDEAWKVPYEGPQGAHWGIWDENAVVKPGMQDVLNGQTTSVVCDGTTCGPGNPSIDPCYVPPYGSVDFFEGQACHVKPALYRAACYIKVGAGWWIKPTSAQPTTIIQTDGSFSLNIVTGGIDQLATQVACFLIPSTYTPPNLLGAAALPDALYQNSLDHFIVARSTNSISGRIANMQNYPLKGVLLDGTVLGQTKSCSSGKYSFYNIPASGTVTLTPSFPNYVFDPLAKTMDITSGAQIVNFVGAPLVDRSVTLSLVPNPIAVGSTLTATVAAANAGIVSASSVTATMSFPASFSNVAASTPGGTCNVASNTVTCALGTLPPTSSATITIQAKPQTLGSFNLSANVSGPEPDANPTNDTSTQTLIVVPIAPILSISKTHAGFFIQGQKNRTYTVVVSNAVSAGPTSATVSVTDTLPAGLTLVGMSGTGWTCGGNNCSRSDSLGPNSSYPPITVTVDVLGGATSPQVNTAGVSGGGSQPTNTTDSTIILPSRTGRIGIFRAGLWVLDGNADAVWNGPPTDRFAYLGQSGDIPITGDWNGDGKDEIGLFRPAEGLWILDYNGDGAWNGPPTDRLGWLGQNGDIPIVGDWNGDDKDEIGFFRPSTGLWILDYNGDVGWNGPSTDRLGMLGQNGDVPLVGDWSGDGKKKIGIFRPSTGMWILDFNGDAGWSGPSIDRLGWLGQNGDTAVVGDWTGDGKDKIGFFRPADGLWILDLNGDAGWSGPSVDRVGWLGMTGDKAIVGDWTGDSKKKIGLFRPSTGMWILDLNGDVSWNGPSVDRLGWLGQNDDTPLSGRW